MVKDKEQFWSLHVHKILFSYCLCDLRQVPLSLPFFFVVLIEVTLVYKFHVDNILFLLLYTLQHAHHRKFKFSSITIQLIPFTHFAPPSPTPSPLVTTTLFSVSTCLFLFGVVCSFTLYVFFSYIPYLCEIIWYLAFSS